VLGFFTRNFIIDFSAFDFNGPTSMENFHICHNKFISPFFIEKTFGCGRGGPRI